MAFGQNRFAGCVYAAQKLSRRIDNAVPSSQIAGAGRVPAVRGWASGDPASADPVKIQCGERLQILHRTGGTRF